MIAPITKNGRRPDCLVMVDAENFGPSMLTNLMAELPKFGKRMTLQAYGVIPSHRKLYESHGFEIHEKLKISTRCKNLVDMQLTIEAIEIGVKFRSVKTFIIVSGDGDFIPLAKKLSELGKRVVSVTGRVPRSLDLLNHVHAAVTLHDPDEKPGPQPAQPTSKKATAKPAQGAPKKKTAKSKPAKPAKQPQVVVPVQPLDAVWLARIRAMIEKLLQQKGNTEINLATLGNFMLKEFAFKPKSFGFSTWKKLLRKHAQDLNCFLIEGTSAVYLRSHMLFV